MERRQRPDEDATPVRLQCCLIDGKHMDPIAWKTCEIMATFIDFVDTSSPLTLADTVQEKLTVMYTVMHASTSKTFSSHILYT